MCSGELFGQNCLQWRGLTSHSVLVVNSPFTAAHSIKPSIIRNALRSGKILLTSLHTKLTCNSLGHLYLKFDPQFMHSPMQGWSDIETKPLF